MAKIIKPLFWVGSSKRDLLSFPIKLISDFGHWLQEAQIGKMPNNAKPLKGFGGAGIIELLEDDRSGTYRVVYTVKIAEAIYVLHCFQKKSKHGIKTPQQEIDLIKKRLADACEAQKKHNRS